MNPKFLEAALVVAILVVVVSAFAETWTQTGAPNVGGGYEALAASADGKKIVAVTSTAHPAVSADSGATWTTNVAANWFNRIAASADGTKWIAVFRSASVNIYVSADSGNTWTQTGSLASTAWNAVAMSADGNKLFAAILNGSIYTSTNFGTNWTATSAPSKAWVCLASSVDGMELAAAAQNDHIFVSTNAGTTWTTNAQSDSWTSIASTADGRRLLASAGSGTYLSTNSGSLWTLVSSNIGQVASSADGRKLVIAGSAIYTSSDSGTTWVSNSAPVTSVSSFLGTSVAASADGCKLYALRSSSLNVWTYQTNLPPNLNINVSTSNQMLLWWLMPSTNLVLQQNLDLTTTNWVTLPDASALNLTNLHEEIFLPSSNQSGFFRLSSQ
jgi:photosystem II stability/assembly factor-like uncharacterized protein